MKLKIVLSTASALALLTGAAWAGSNNNAVIDQGNSANSGAIDQSAGNSNTAKFVQDGVNNNASVTQSGNNNRAGAHVANGWADSSETARGYDYMIQSGSDNSLTILQTRNGNNVAIGNGKVVQSGNQNVIDITQHGGASAGGSVTTILQTDQTNAATALANKVTILQQGATPGDYADVNPASSDYNYAYESIVSVTQTNTGGAANLLTLTQKGGIYGAGNTISTVLQNGSNNTGTVGQEGRKNLLASLSQVGSGNSATVSVTGDRNGAGLLTGAAAASNASSSVVQQIGAGNQVGYTVLGGNDNQFGFYQDDTGAVGNRAVSILITGSGNQLGVHQVGTNNSLDLASIAGDDNNIGLDQSGDSNNASVTIAGTGGSNGGAHDFTPGKVAASAGLTAGLIKQSGTLNSATFDVTGSDNVFASLQDNTAFTTGTLKNTIKGTINGSSNEAAVVQVGNNNTTNFTQSGGSNYASIKQ